jgi:hypothetical protein
MPMPLPLSRDAKANQAALLAKDNYRDSYGINLDRVDPNPERVFPLSAAPSPAFPPWAARQTPPSIAAAPIAGHGNGEVSGPKQLAAVVTVPRSPSYVIAPFVHAARSSGNNESFDDGSVANSVAHSRAPSLGPEAHSRPLLGGSAATSKQTAQQTTALPARKPASAAVAKASSSGPSSSNAGGWGRLVAPVALGPRRVDVAAAAHTAEPPASQASHRGLPGRKIGQWSAPMGSDLPATAPPSPRRPPAATKPPQPQSSQAFTPPAGLYGGLSRSAATAASAEADLRAAAAAKRATAEPPPPRGGSASRGAAARREYTVGVAASAQSQRRTAVAPRPRAATAPEPPPSVNIPRLPLVGQTNPEGAAGDSGGGALAADAADRNLNAAAVVADAELAANRGMAHSGAAGGPRPQSAATAGHRPTAFAVSVVREGRAHAPGPRLAVRAGPQAMP